MLQQWQQEPPTERYGSDKCQGLFSGAFWYVRILLEEKSHGLISEEVLLLQHKLAKDAHCEKRNDTLEIASNIFSSRYGRDNRKFLT